jgi:hypothetical protein
MLSAVQRRLTDVVDVAVGDARGRAAVIAVDKDPEIVRTKYLGRINRGIDVVDVNSKCCSLWR